MILLTLSRQIASFVDDIHFVSGNSTVQCEILMIVDHFIENKMQLVITSNTHPNKLDGIASRLCTKFKWGLIIDITLPEKE
ncbi:MAG: hypothetical protein J1E05_05220 [Eubacterium sp.]|nr:hypothetical protein [Eubacterium sp.]